MATIYKCDLCGKVSNSSYDMANFSLRGPGGVWDFNEFRDLDLCSDCYDKLVRHIKPILFGIQEEAKSNDC